ncbi:hypothetical protein HNV12_01390 [Methanococcoides sp. SA1]|nr:hypothetical protein [Methanococcoides sp. SA1]
MVKDLRDAIKEVMEKSGGGKNSAGMGDGAKVAHHMLSFDSQQNQLEPIYYWVLDFAAQIGFPLKEKLIDNFMASPGSGQFSEMSGKATRMQEEGMKILGGMNQIIKSVLNLIYDLKEFELRLANYDDAKSDDKEKKNAGRLALKQVWLDNVDIKRQRGAIHAMANEMGFSTLREAFMIVDSVEDVKRMNSEDKKEGGAGLINDSVMRILIPRVNEFNKWVDYSEKELRKRFSIEKNYLKSQVESVKLYSQWMKPYLESAEKLRQQGFEKDSALVNAFSTTMFELQLMGVKPAQKKDSEINGYKFKRGYNKVVVVTMKYRGHVSQRVTQKGDYGFGMGGVVDIYFDAYALNDEELEVARSVLKKSDVEEAATFSMDTADEALKDLKEDLDYFLKSDEEKEKEDAKEKKSKKKSEDINPFSALFGLFKKSDKKKEKEGEKIEEASDIRKDNFFEKKARAACIGGAAGTLYTIYDVYKKAHRMASAPGKGFDNVDAGTVEDLEQGGSVGIREIFEKKD